MKNFKIDSINGNGDVYYIENIDFIFRIPWYQEKLIVEYQEYFNNLWIETSDAWFWNIKLLINTYKQIEEVFSKLELNTQFINNNTYSSTLFFEINNTNNILNLLNKYIISLKLDTDDEAMILYTIHQYLYKYCSPCENITSINDIPKKEEGKFNLIISWKWNSVWFNNFQQKVKWVYTYNYINENTVTNIVANNVWGETILRTVLAYNISIQHSVYDDDTLCITSNRLDDDIFNNGKSLLIKSLKEKWVSEDILINMIEIINWNK